MPNLTDTQVGKYDQDVGFGPGTDDTTTGTTFVIDSDNDGITNSILNLNDDFFETVFDPFGNPIGNNDTFGVGKTILGGNRIQNLQTDLMNFNNQNNQNNQLTHNVDDTNKIIQDQYL